jgi:hypothetical protein
MLASGGIQRGLASWLFDRPGSAATARLFHAPTTADGNM